MRSLCYIFYARCFSLCAPTRQSLRRATHLLVLSAFRPSTTGIRRHSQVLPSQCTFWCSVPSDQANQSRRRRTSCLNAPSGAQCFRTPTSRRWRSFSLSGLNAPSGAQCFPTMCSNVAAVAGLAVSMHLLVLSALRHCESSLHDYQGPRLNAPSGAQCFPTRRPARPRGAPWRLNAPSGAQCFPTMTGIRPKATGDASQCTFWCSVLSDSDAMSWTSTFSCVSMHLLVLSAFRL